MTSRLAVVVFMLLSPAVASAEVTAEEMAAARQLGTEGYVLAAAGKCSEAIPKLQKAAELFPAPTIVERLGECQVAIGKLVLGSETLQKVVNQDLGPKPSNAFVEAKKRARKLLDETRPRIAKLTIKVRGAPRESLKITIDDVALSTSLVDLPRPTDPGAHAVTASAEGYVAAKRTIVLADGDSAEIVLDLAPVASAPPPEEAPLPAPVSDGPKVPAPSFRVGTLTWVTFGIASAGLLAGSYFGLRARQQKSRLDESCPSPDACPLSRQSDIASLKTTANLSTLSFAIATVSAGAGVILLLWSPSSEPAARATARPYVGLGSIGVQGVF